MHNLKLTLAFKQLPVVKMKIAFITLLFLFGLQIIGQAQTDSVMNSCPKFPGKVNIYIPGYKDTTQPNGLKARTINAETLVEGFRLLSSDTSVKIQQFTVVFDFVSKNPHTLTEDVHLYSQTTKGDQMLNKAVGNFSLTDITKANIITIEYIKVQYKGVCYSMSPQVYFPSAPFE
jgi:hypothetical protein